MFYIEKLLKGFVMQTRKCVTWNYCIQSLSLTSKCRLGYIKSNMTQYRYILLCCLLICHISRVNFFFKVLCYDYSNKSLMQAFWAICQSLRFNKSIILINQFLYKRFIAHRANFLCHPLLDILVLICLVSVTLEMHKLLK